MEIGGCEAGNRPGLEDQINKKPHLCEAWHEIYYLGDPPPGTKYDAGIILKSWEKMMQFLIR